jgi:riboflavin biosynthesis pyrimidine reductase
MCIRDRLEPRAILAELRRRGVRRLFVEGGGVTVSRFLAAGCLDRLQLCVAPVVIGSGRPALRLPEITRMAEALRLAPLTLPMGCDTLFAAELTRRPLETGLARQPQEIVMADAG